MLNDEKMLFEELNKRLQQEDMELTIICAGGFVLKHYGMRTTQDIDGFFESSNKLNKIIKEIGDKFGINNEDELWLNNSIQNMNQKPNDEICDTLYEFSNLRILIPPLEYIAGMKLISARQQDIEDVGAIVKMQGLQSPEEFTRILRHYGFGNIDESLVLESFGIAYGFEWLEKYYVENEEQINRKIQESE